MATYVLPQVQVFQSFTATPVAVTNPLPGHVAGGDAWLIRFAESAEQQLGFLGYYDDALDHDFSWPNLPSGATVDETYTKVFIKDALLQYYQTTEGVGSIGGSDDLTKVAGFSNRIASDIVNFADNLPTYPRSDVLLRDVKPGDVARVRAKDLSDNVHTLWTTVQSVKGVTLSPTVGSATSDIDNLANQSDNSSQSQTAGVSNTLTITSVDDSTYDGLTSGFVNETYDLLVTASSVGGDLTTATVRVISGSGTDDQAAINPAASASPTTIGTRDMKITWTAGTPGDNLVAGQRWHVIVITSFTHTSATSGGTYTGSKDTTYIVEVTKGGLYAASPQISVTTTNGVDASGPTDVTATGTFVAIGNFGTTIKFNGTGLRKGDRFYVVCAASAVGPMRILVFNNSLDPSIPDNASCDLELFILKASLTVPPDRVDSPPLTNWDQSSSDITIKAGITATDSSWVDAGVPVPLPVTSESSQEYGGVYVEYRAWKPDLSTDVYSISDPGQLDTQLPGALTPDNPLKWGVFNALENNNGVDVKYTAVADPGDPDSWADVLGLLLGRTDIYNLSPMTRDPLVLSLYKAHILDQSSPIQGAWRAGWFNLPGIPLIPLVAAGSIVPNHTAASTSDGEVALATINGSGNLTVTCTSGNAIFQTNGVVAGDSLRANFGTDGFGNVSYDSFTIAEVVSQEVLLLEAGPLAAVNVAAKIEVWRTLTSDQEVNEIIEVAGTYGDKRIRMVWPDQITGSGFTMDGFFLCAALGSLAGGILPHQGMTRLAVSGYTEVPETNRKLTRAQLDKMAAAGIFIVTQDPVSGTVYVRQAVTSAVDQADPQQREEMFIRNLDSVSFQFMSALGPYIGIANVTPGTVLQIQNTLATTIEGLKTDMFTVTLGGQISAGSVTRVVANTTFQDRIAAVVNLTLPFADNGVDLSLAI